MGKSRKSKKCRKSEKIGNPRKQDIGKVGNWKKQGIKKEGGGNEN